MRFRDKGSGVQRLGFIINLEALGLAGPYLGACGRGFGVQSGLNVRTTTWQKCEAVPRSGSEKGLDSRRIDV